MSDDPYATPKAPVVRDAPPEVPPAPVLAKIKGAWIAAVVSGSITLVVILIALGGTSIMGITSANFVDVALIFGLAFGIYRKSRTCAVLMFVYFVASKILMMKQAGAPSGLLLAVVFAALFFQGIVGTFQYHNWKAAQGN